MKKNIFEEEFERRERYDENAYSMIGTELKRLRTSQSQTLSAVADELCSVSYLCKVENAKIKPNRFMLGELCKKLNVETPKVDILFKLKSYVKDMVKAFYENDKVIIEGIYKSCGHLDNYRSKLISCIYNVYNCKFEYALKEHKELIKIASVMHDDELRILTIFSAILSYYNENYLEALENLKLIDGVDVNSYAHKIANYYILFCYIKLNHPLSLVHSQKLIDDYLKESSLDKVQFIRYLQAVYKINNDMIDYARADLPYLTNKKYRKTIEFYIDCITKTLKSKSYYDELRPFARLLHIYIFDNSKYYNSYLKISKCFTYDCDFSNNIVNYLTLTDDENKSIEIINVIVPNILSTKNMCERKFFLNELCRISINLGRYKNFCKLYNSLLLERF